MKRECGCPKPVRHPNPIYRAECVRCGRTLDASWSATDETFAAFFSWLATTFPGDVPDWFRSFRAQCAERDQHGRSYFGYAYLTRDNLAEATEEAADLAMYCWLDVLKARRARLDENADLALTAAYHAARAYEALSNLQSKRRGSP